MAADAPLLERVEAFLAKFHGKPVTELEPLCGGFWSAAYGYEVNDRELVVLTATRS